MVLTAGVGVGLDMKSLSPGVRSLPREIDKQTDVPTQCDPSSAPNLDMGSGNSAWRKQ